MGMSSTLLRELGTPTYIGENGQGLVLKLAVNISLAVQMLALSEGLLMAERDGVDRKLALEVHDRKRSRLADAEGACATRSSTPPARPGSTSSLMHKDIRLALSTARGLHIPVPSAHAVDEVLTRAGELGYEHHDIAVLRKILATEPENSGR